MSISIAQALSALAAFIALGLLGYFGYRSSKWLYVDICYYPLAAMGLTLLFTANSSQREQFELSQVTEAHRRTLAEMITFQPLAQSGASGDLLSSSLELVATIPKFADSCTRMHGLDGRCGVAARFAAPLTAFLQSAASANGQTQDQRLATICRSADTLLTELRSSNAVSPSIGQELLSVYDEALKANVQPAAFDSARKQVDTFSTRGARRIEWIKEAVKLPAASFEPVVEQYKAEVELGQVVLHALLPCIVAPRTAPDGITRRAEQRNATDDEILSSARRAATLSAEATSANPVVARLHLVLWPFVLSLALALKFGKGIASLRKGTSD